MSSEKENLNFEDAIINLEEIVRELEKGDLNLEQSVQKFEEGMNLSKKCSKMLDEAEKKITILINTENGVTEEKFEAES